MIATSLAPRLLAASLVLGWVLACSSKESDPPPPFPTAGRAGATGEGGIGGNTPGAGGTAGSGAVAGFELSFGGAKPACQRKTCAELGVGCGKVVDECNRTGPPIDCAEEGLTCGAQEVCIGGGDMPAKCETSFGPCAVCDAIPDCKAAGTPTVLKGRVVTPGRTDADTANQVGVPNAVVYILRSADVTEIPLISSGIPMGETSCDRCDTLELGPTLVGAITDATGRFTLNEHIPVGVEFLLVVKVGKFRRVVKHTVPASAACTTVELPTALPDNPARLPRSMTDGLAVNIPTIAVSTGEVDAMECVLEKMGLQHELFGNPVPTITAETPRIHLYRGLSGTGIGPGGPGGPGGGDAGAGGMEEPERGGASIDPMTPVDDRLYESLPTLQRYDFVIADCEGSGYDSRGDEREKWGANVREYVNRGGRLFSSHLSYTWLHGNGEAPYDAATATGTGLDPASSWSTAFDGNTPDGIGAVALGRPQASPRVQNFSDWLTSEGVLTPQLNTFDIYQPRSQSTGIGEFSEEFVFLQNRTMRTQQFSFNTPYGAPEEAVCGRVAYSGFHVAATMGSGGNLSPFKDIQFPAHCTGGLTAQEKVLLYMIFDLGACIGEIPPPPKCEPQTCESTMTECGYISDGCGGVEDCGPCPVPVPK